MLLLCLMPPLVFAQEFKDNEIVVIDGVKYVMHAVKSGETISSICEKYDINNRELINNNPKLIQGLNIGDLLKIPYHEKVEAATEKIVPQSKPVTFFIHTIKRRETPFFVAKEYGITVEDIYKYNPGLTRFKKGESIKIPQFNESPAAKGQPVKQEKNKEQEVVEESKVQQPEMIEYTVKPDETLFSISKLLNRPISEILHYNPDAQPLKIGMVLKLPEDSTTFQVNPESERVGDYFIHMIETGETLYGISKKYNVSENELKELNPVLETGFPAGVRIKIPVDNMPPQTTVPVNENAFLKHVVKRGENLYRLSTEYRIKIPELKKVNPALADRDELVEGETILIPAMEDNSKTTIGNESQPEEIVSPETTRQEVSVPPDNASYDVAKIVEIPEGCRPVEANADNFTTYRIGLLLPLYLEANDTLNNKPVAADTLQVDTMKQVETEIDTIGNGPPPENKAWSFYGNSEDFLNIYDGVLLAIDSMRNRGMNIELYVYDTSQGMHAIDSLLSTDDFLGLNLIIGPVNTDLQVPVAAFAFKNRIPMVSPISPDSRLAQTNPYYFQVNPSLEFIQRKTADYIADEYYDSNFIVLNIGNPTPQENMLVDLCRERLYNSGYYRDINDVTFRMYDFNKFKGQGLSHILSKDRENVFIIPSLDVGDVSVALSNINNYTSDYDITVIGNYRYRSKNFESIDQEYFHNVKLKFWDPFWPDYSAPAMKKFISEFRTYFSTDPSPYSMQGYDIAFYFLNAFRYYGKDFYNCMPYLQIGLTQGNYKFEKVSRFGGYMNQGVSLISYKRNYTVVKEQTAAKIKYVYK